MARFSERHGYASDDAVITVLEDAPEELRGVMVDIAYEAGLDPHDMRSLVCRVLRVREDPSNWSAFPNVDSEVRQHLDRCARYEVYDVIEAVYARVGKTDAQSRGAFSSAPKANSGPAFAFAELGPMDVRRHAEQVEPRVLGRRHPVDKREVDARLFHREVR